MTGLSDTKIRDFWRDNFVSDDLEAIDAIQQLAHAAWRPASDPPSADRDGDHDGMVMIWAPFAGLGMTHPNRMDRLPPGAKWARIRDVVLLPPQSTTGEGE